MTVISSGAFVGSTELLGLVQRMASRTAKGRTEADLQGDLRTLLLYGGLALEEDQVVRLEEPSNDGTRRRLDVAVGVTVFELKNDLRAGETRRKGEDQLAGYLRLRTEQNGHRYNGVLTDGAEWHLYYMLPGRELEPVASFIVDPSAPDATGLASWLESVLATGEEVLPSPQEVTARLGAGSPAYQLDRAELMVLYTTCQSDPEVVVKRSLWSKLLITAFGTEFVDEADLFVEHTYLVLISELIAHAVVGFDLADGSLSPDTLVSGAAFSTARVYGVVEADFFDWVLRAPGGRRFVQGLARRLARIKWADVEHDVLKLLYESIIAAPQRHGLGEYYTPDWLAEGMVGDAVQSPLEQKVLDPACGSGTFLFHAVRLFLERAEASGWSNSLALKFLTDRVAGIDVHPVAVTLARVTYLLAIGSDRLQDPEREDVFVPVFLGDSVQWAQNAGVLTSGSVVVPTGEGSQLFANELIFPESLVADAPRFDGLVTAMSEKVQGRLPGAPPGSLRPLFRRYAIPESEQPTLAATYATMCELNDMGRNHIWGYYVRNLVRPLWLARPENHVDVLVGNPPWLAYSHMTVKMKEDYQQACRDRGLWPGGTRARNQDLSAFFVARCIELYLRDEGRFAFVMPASVLSRQQYEGFRAADFSGSHGELRVAFDEPRDLTAIKPSPFPVPCSVVTGRRTPQRRALPRTAEIWSGRLPRNAASWAAAASLITRSAQTRTAVTTGVLSPYSPNFAAGANIRPRALLCVETVSRTPLGVGRGRLAVRSRRSAQEKPPWRDLPSQSGVVEAQFVRRFHLGLTVLPFRLLDPWLCVVPLHRDRLIRPEDGDWENYPDLATWWREMDRLWRENNKQGEQLKLIDQVDYRRSLSNQVPAPRERVVYTKSGMNLAAARVGDVGALIDHKLYWAAVTSPAEAWYLCAILNSGALLEMVKPLQAVGQFGPRDFDKYVFALPIPLFDERDDLHSELAMVGQASEDASAALPLPEGVEFKIGRRLIRQNLERLGLTGRADELVRSLLSAR
jgi:hypothetical protein